MALTLAKVRGQIRSELMVTESQLPDALILDYLNLVQIEVAKMLGPVAAAGLRKRSADLNGKGCVEKANDLAGDYDDTAKTISGFTGLTVNAHAGDGIIFYGTWSVGTKKAFKDIIVSNTATVVTVAGNNAAGANSDAGTVVAVIPYRSHAIDPGTMGIALPADCLQPLYLETDVTPSSAERINIVRLDDTETFLQNPYWDAEAGAAVQIGDALHIMKGSSGTFPTIAVLVYVRRPADYSSDSDEMKISSGRLPEEFWGIIRSGILKLSAMHMHRADQAKIHGDYMTERVASIHRAWGMEEAVKAEEEATR